MAPRAQSFSWMSTEHAPTSLAAAVRQSQNFTPHVHRTARVLEADILKNEASEKNRHTSYARPRSSFFVPRSPPAHAGAQALARSVRAKFHRRPPQRRTSTQRAARRFPLRFNDAHLRRPRNGRGRGVGPKQRRCFELCFQPSHRSQGREAGDARKKQSRVLIYNEEIGDLAMGSRASGAGKRLGEAAAGSP